MQWWLSFVLPVPDPKARMEEHSKRKIGRMEPMTQVTCEPICRLKGQTLVGDWENSSATQVVWFTWMLMSNGWLMYDLQAEGSEWVFKSPLAGTGAYCGGRTTGCTACLFFPADTDIIMTSLTYYVCCINYALQLRRQTFGTAMNTQDWWIHWPVSWMIQRASVPKAQMQQHNTVMQQQLWGEVIVLIQASCMDPFWI